MRVTTMTAHKKTHSLIKQYKCQVCAKEFHEAGNLIVHERIHVIPSLLNAIE
jgi:hypothetical protein